MARLQEQAATGSRINRVSDAPSEAYRVLGLNSQLRNLGNYINDLSEVIGMLEVSSTIIIGGDTNEAGMKDIFTNAKVLLASITDTDGEIGQVVNAEEVDNYLEQIVLLANSRHMNQYLFGGSDTNSAPYLVERTNGKITYVTYQGSSEDRDIEVAPGVQSSAFHIGEDIFCSNNRSDPEFLLGSTGAQPGTGTSSVTGYTWLTITEDTDPTKYRLSINDGDDYVTVLKGKGSEIQTLDFEGKTPTGGSFTLTFDHQTTSAIDSTADADTIKAALVALPNLDADDIVSVTGTFATDFTITFADTMGDVPEVVVPPHTLVDGGGAITITPATTTEGIGDINLAVTDSRTGQILYVDTTGISVAGVELVSVAGTHDIFNTLITLRDIFENVKGLSSDQLRTLRNNSVDAVEEMRNLLVKDSVSMGSKMELLDNLRSNLEDMEFNTEDEKTRLEEADIAQIAIDLTRREVLYEMSLSMAARLLSMSLLDFLR
ncbi:MAG: flagellin [Planctomycetota bacterium]|jgi:flagellin-like hook-associated protein FlgL